jgi:hypothetical protein
MGADGHVLIYSRERLEKLFGKNIKEVWEHIAASGHFGLPRFDSPWEIDQEMWAYVKYMEKQPEYLVLYWDTEDYNYPDFLDFKTWTPETVKKKFEEINLSIWNEFNVYSDEDIENLLEKMKDGIKGDWPSDLERALAIESIQVWT